MNLIEVMEQFPDQESCIERLEGIRWRGTPVCPFCECKDVRRKKEASVGRVGRWNCKECGASFKVTHGTVFHGTKIPLQKWFLAIVLMVNAKKSLSSYQLSRDLGLKQKTTWRLIMCIRAEMGKENVLLQGIVEADETYIGGKGRKDYDKDSESETKKSTAGRGTVKDTVLGAVARGGKVVAQLVPDAKSLTITEFIKKNVDIDQSDLYTDQYRAYNDVGEIMRSHEKLNRSEKWEPDGIHTNTMEGFWSFVKRAWYGSHHYYTTGYTPLYLAEACFKYNHRKEDSVFGDFLFDCMRC